MRRILTLLILVFVIQTNAQQYQVLYNFGGTNGYNPGGSLISDGTYLYGMTTYGGVSYNGNIVKIKPNGTGFSNLFSFNGTTGKTSQGSLVMCSDGYFYGMTTEGGTNNDGVIFKIKPNGSNYTKLLNFNDTNGKWPIGSLISDSTYLYGMAQGVNNGYGTIFKIKHDGTGFTNLFDFNDSTGFYPVGSLLLDSNYLYGMTEGETGVPEGGILINNGVIFKIKTDGTDFTKLHVFDSISGAHPNGNLISDGTYLYGTTIEGGTSNDGIIFKIKPDGTGFDTLLNFTGTNGIGPSGSLISDGTYLYGMTSEGGASISADPNGYGYGTIFKIQPDGIGYQDLFDFNGTNGYNPVGSLLSDSIYLYGMTTRGGTGFNATTYNYGDGVIFKLCYTNSCSSGIEQFNDQNSQIKIYPNPVNSILQVSISNETLGQIKIVDVLGNEVMVKPTPNPSTGGELLRVDVSALPNGVYFIQVGTSTQKFIVQH